MNNHCGQDNSYCTDCSYVLTEVTAIVCEYMYALRMIHTMFVHAHVRTHEPTSPAYVSALRSVWLNHVHA